MKNLIRILVGFILGIATTLSFQFLDKSIDQRKFTKEFHRENDVTGELKLKVSSVPDPTYDVVIQRPPKDRNRFYGPVGRILSGYDTFLVETIIFGQEMESMIGELKLTLYAEKEKLTHFSISFREEGFQDRILLFDDNMDGLFDRRITEKGDSTHLEYISYDFTSDDA